jgi:hypothetical protein
MTDVMEVDAQTGDVVVRDMTAGEAAQRTKDLAKQVALAEAKAARTAAREALLTKLGITAEEAQLLLGGM